MHVMVTTIQHCFCIPSPSVTIHPLLNKTQQNPPLRMLRFSPKPPIKEICKKGNLNEAFKSFTNLLTDPNPSPLCLDEAYSSLLELCAAKKAVSQGMQIHAHIITSNATLNSVFLGTKLVFMYGKCGFFWHAEKLFDKMPHRNVFTWNAIIGACVTKGDFLRVLELYQEMRISGVPLDSCTFPSVMKACGGLMDLHQGAEIHGLAIKYGYVSVVFVANSLVAMYAKCNDLSSARQLFDRITTERKDVVSWNSIIAAYSANGQSGEALELLREMQTVNGGLSTYTFVAALQACEQPTFRKLGMEIHAAILKSSHCLDVYVANSLIVMYARCGKMRDAVIVFNIMDEKDNISWNSVLAGFVQNNLYSEATKFFCSMQNAGQKPDQVSLLSIAAASGRMGNLLNAKEVHAYAIKVGLDTDLHVGNTLIDMYAKCCCVQYMDRVFDKMLNKDIITWTTSIAGHCHNNNYAEALGLLREGVMAGMGVDEMMIGSILLACSGLKCISLLKEIHGFTIRNGLSDLVLKNSIVDAYGECRNVDYASRVFRLIENKDVVSWTSIISSYVDNGFANEALEQFCLMEKSCIEPDSVALLSLLSAVASLSALKKGKEIHGFLIRKGFSLAGSVANALVDMYARCGMVNNSCKIFNAISKKDRVLWTSMINAYGMHGHGKAAVNMFKTMVNQNIAPDHITFLALLYACSHSGLINEGRSFFEVMKCEYQLEPWPEHYACLVDLLARANRLQEAYKFVRSMQIHPTAVVWCALLSACRIHSDKEIGDIAAKELLNVDPEYSGNYVLVSNVYAATGRWKDAEDARMRMKGKGLMKNPGCSWIELGNKVHTFMARGMSHPESDKIYETLAQVTKTLEKEGSYAAETKFVLRNVDEQEKIKMLYGHSERLAIAYGLLRTPEGTPIRITKNLRVCGDCHTFCKLVTRFFGRRLIIRDANRFHHFEDGTCSCGDFW